MGVYVGVGVVCCAGKLVVGVGGCGGGCGEVWGLGIGVCGGMWSWELRFGEGSWKCGVEGAAGGGALRSGLRGETWLLTVRGVRG